MAKSRSVLVDYAVYLALRTFVCVIQALSLEWGCKLGAALAWLVYKLDKQHRQVALDNLQHAFPGKYTPAELDALVRAVFRHFCTLIVDIVHLPRRFHSNTWRRFVQLPQGSVLLDQLLSGRPLMFLTGHFGNWELGGFILGALGFQTHAIARTLDNPFVDWFLRVKFREKTGQHILSKDDDFERIQRVLADKGVLATLADQDAGQR